jgi:hypothetical protein
MITTWLLVETYRGMRVINQLDLQFNVAFDSTAHFISRT